jgi:phage repressor protein C with HTH and peptisase S24 domain
MTSTPAARLRALSKAAGFARLAEFARAAKVPDTNMRQHISRDSIPKDAAALYVGAARRAGVVTATAEWLLFGQGVAPRGTDLLPVEKNPPAIRKEAVSAIANSPIALVVYRTRAGLIGAGAVLVFRDKAGLVTRPAELEASSEAFALVVQGDDWEPRYRRRDTLLVDPSSLNPPAPEDDCLFVKDPEANPFTAIARRLVRITAEHWVVKRFEKDAPEELFPIAEFPAAWRIFGAYNRR